VELTFQPGANGQCTSITIVNDSILENDENVLVELTTSDEAVVLNPTSATITITTTLIQMVSGVSFFDRLWH